MPIAQLSELKEWRNKFGVSQEKLARLSGLGLNTIAKLESGVSQPQAETTRKLMDTIAKIESNPEMIPTTASTSVPDDFASKMKEWRTTYGLSQEKLAKLAQLGVNTVAKIELGVTRMMPQTINKLKSVFSQVESGIIAIPKSNVADDHMAGFNPEDLRAWRKKHHISQEKLARTANIGINTLIKLEGGTKVQKNTLASIMQAVREINREIKERVAAEVPPIEPKAVARRGRRKGTSPKPASARKSESRPAPEHEGASTLDLKSWRKRFGLTQGKLAELAKLSLNTVMKLEAGAREVQKRTLDRLLQAIKTVEGDAAPAVPAASSAPTVPPPASPTPAPSAHTVAPLYAVPPLQLTNLDLELINRVILMSVERKIQLLEKMMEQDAGA